MDDKEFLKMIVDCCDHCEFCSKFKKPFSRPEVRFPVSDRFNQYISMDLKEVEKGKVWLLHLIDAATKYTAACLIRRKKKELVVYCGIFQIRVAYFRARGKFYSDCGGKFVNDVFREMSEKLGIETITTPGTLPFSNGLIERNKVFYEAPTKAMEDAKCHMETALAWAVSAKNALQNHILQTS